MRCFIQKGLHQSLKICLSVLVTDENRVCISTLACGNSVVRMLAWCLYSYVKKIDSCFTFQPQGSSSDLVNDEEPCGWNVSLIYLSLAVLLKSSPNPVWLMHALTWPYSLIPCVLTREKYTCVCVCVSNLSRDGTNGKISWWLWFLLGLSVY